MTRIAVVILFLVGIAQGATPIHDEALRLRVLKAVFPGAAVSGLQVKAGGVREYLIAGPVQADEESAAVDILARDKPASDRRRTHIRLFRSGNHLIAFITYSFDGANPARCCLAIGKIVLLTIQGDRVLSTVRKAPHAFSDFTNVQFIRDVSTGGELSLVGMNGGGAGNAGEESIVLSVAQDRLVPLAVFTSALSGMLLDESSDADYPIEFRMTFDKRRTHFGADRRLWFIKRTTMDRKRFVAPKVEHIAIPIGSTPVSLDQ